MTTWYEIQSRRKRDGDVPASMWHTEAHIAGDGGVTPEDLGAVWADLAEWRQGAGRDMSYEYELRVIKITEEVIMDGLRRGPAGTPGEEADASQPG